MIGVFFYNCYKDKCLLSRSDSCIDGDWICRYEQAAIERGSRRRLGLRPAVVGGT